jgi:hypothetical protein
MLYYLALGLGAFLSFLMLKWQGRQFYRLAENSVALLNTLLSAEEDEEKLASMEKQTSRALVSLLSFIGLLLLALLIMATPPTFYSYFEKGAWSFISISGWQELLSISIGASLIFIPLPQSDRSGYSDLSQLLHRLVLNNYNIGLKLFKREAKQQKGIQLKEEFIIVSGLARAGTTSLMNHLLSIDGFRSLSYANMPFLLSPKTWGKIYKPKDKSTSERSHKDGIKIGLNSNEALEEHFFKALAADKFIKNDHLKEYELSPEEYQGYLSYQTLVRKQDSDIYLAKNNNYLLRYKSIRKQNPHFIFVILFRQPLFHAASLLEKHLLYSEMQRHDPFVEEYMDWLGHHEFGLNQKAFLFAKQVAPEGDKTQLNYWLKIWINYYQYALNINDEKTLFIQYESFCTQPQENLALILEKGNHAIEAPKIEGFENPRKTEKELGFDALLMDEALTLYKSLQLKTVITE